MGGIAPFRHISIHGGSAPPTEILSIRTYWSSSIPPGRHLPRDRGPLRSAMVVHIYGAVERSEYDPPCTGITCGGVDGCFRLIWLWGIMPNVLPMDSAPMERYRSIAGYG